MDRVSSMRLVARREIVERVKTKGFRFSTLLYTLLAIAVVVVPRTIGDRSTTYDVGLVGEASARAAPLIAEALVGAEVRTRVLADQARAEEAVRDGTVDVVLVDGVRLLARSVPSAALSLAVDRAVLEARLTDRFGGEAAGVLRAPRLELVVLEEESPRQEANRPLAYAGTTLTYFMILSYGVTVANGVLEEKSSRVSELLLTTLRPAQLLGGKIVGIGVVALFQLLTIGTAVVVASLASGGLSVPKGTPLTFLAIPVWVVLGYGLYSSLYGAAAAAAGRPEELGNVTTPLTLTILASYFISIASGGDPDHIASVVASFVPLMAPMTMLPRAATGNVAPWQVALSMAMVVGTTVLAVRFSSRIYAGAIGRGAGRVRFRDAWRASRA